MSLDDESQEALSLITAGAALLSALFLVASSALPYILI